jgi:hypothetical protein
MCAYVLIRGGHKTKGWWCGGERRGGVGLKVRIGGLSKGEGGEEGRGGERRGEEGRGGERRGEEGRGGERRGRSRLKVIKGRIYVCVQLRHFVFATKVRCVIVYVCV